MSLLQFEEFVLPELLQFQVTSRPAVSEAELERAKVKSYDNGFQAGWDDAVATQANEHENISAEFANNLRDMNFTFHEAGVQLMRSFRPLLTEMAAQVLPTLAAETATRTILEELIPLFQAQLDTPMEIVAAPANKGTVEALLKRMDSNVAVFVEEPTFGEGQILARVGASEKEINLTAVTDKIMVALNSMYSALEEES